MRFRFAFGKRIGRLAALALLSAAPCSGEEAVVDDHVWFDEAMEQCSIDAPELEQYVKCVGVAAEICAEKAPGGQSNLGYAQCLHHERAGWEAMMAHDLEAALDHLAMWERVLGYDAGRLQDQLKENQRLWEQMRDSTCTLRTELVGPGSMSVPARAFCYVRQTAERAYVLAGYLEIQ